MLNKLVKLLACYLIIHDCLACQHPISRVSYLDKEHHHSLFYYVVHSTVRIDPFRGPGCKKCYPPVLKTWEFAQ